MALQGIISLFTALLLGGCMQATLSQTTQNPVSDANFTARDKQQLANPPYERA
jgi:PBP1b-binding outer membrane lipoprotein LpoB